MNAVLIPIRFIGGLVALFVTIAAAAKSLPETNALQSEVKITAPVDLSNGHFGSLVAARSNLFVVGFRKSPDSHPDTPLAAVYSRKNSSFELDATLYLPAVTNLTVHSLATDGHRIVFAGSESGSTIDDATPVIYLFSQSSGEWSLETRLLPSTSVSSVSISRDVIVAGAPFQAVLFEKAGDSWVESSVHPPDDIPSAVRNGFGADVAIDNGTIVVGARGEIRSDPGRAYAFVRASNGWQLQAELLPEPFIFTPFGSVVAIEGDTVLVSAFMNRFNSGMVFVYERSADSWTRTGTLQGHNQDFFGQSLALSGRNLVVGAPSAFSGSGGVYLFRRNGSAYDRTALYREDLQTVNPGNGDPGAFLGYDVAIVDDMILAGAPYQDGSAQNSGVAFVFEFEFELRLEEPWARAEDASFHFEVTGAKPGLIYVVETSASPAGEWTVAKEFTAYIGDMQVEVDIPAGSSMSFFKVRTK